MVGFSLPHHVEQDGGVSTRTNGGVAGRFRPLGRAVARRLRLLGWAFLLAVLGLAGLGLLAVILLALPLLALFPVGAWLLLATVWLVRRFADAHRWIIGSTLHDGRQLGYGSAAFDPGGLRLLRDGYKGVVKLPHTYPPWPSGSRWRQLRQLAGEPATWRDLTWLLVAGPAGFLVLLLIGVPPAVFVHYASLPLQYALVGPGQPVTAGPWAVDSQAVSFIGTPIGLVGLLLWWWIAPPVMRGYALLSQRLLGTAATTGLTTRIRGMLAPRSASVNPTAATPARRARLHTLTRRERDVLALIAEGRTNAAIAARLHITEKAVDKHVNSVFRKLELTRTAEDNRRVLAALTYLHD
jgi:DNA-binding CsgD family transcriptional regulator